MRDSRVLVTGASSGIGRETAVALASRGARVLAVARSADELQELEAEHPGITAHPADVTVEADRAGVVEAAGPVDVLVNNAGRGWTGIVEDMAFDEVRSLFELNVLALIDLTQRVLPQMLARRSGQIVNVASIAGYVAAPPLTVYSATKFAVQGFTDGLRREVSGRGVEVTLINPGPVNTRFFARSTREQTGTDAAAPAFSVPAWTVANAIVRSIERAALPGYDTVAVPRVAGFSRLATLPGASFLIDAGARLVRPERTYGTGPHR